MHSHRYGNLARIAAKTGDRCHLCHEPVDLNFYGPTGLYGEDTVTVDHLIPVSLGGDDGHDNLMIAHGHCNSRRGIDLAEVARLAIVGSPNPPMSEGEQIATALFSGTGAAILAGHAFAVEEVTGTRRFNGKAALGFGLAAGFLALALT